MTRADRHAAAVWPWFAVAVCCAVVAAVDSGQSGRTRGAGTGSAGFVTRVGSHLFLDGKPFRWGGGNIYWLGLDENVGGVAYPTQFRVQDALDTAALLGLTVIRGHTLGISTGNSLSFEPELGVFNASALDSADFAISGGWQWVLRFTAVCASCATA